MTREEAERERDRLVSEDPKSTWIIHERDGEWAVARVGLKPTEPGAAHVESKPKPPESDDPRPAHFRNVGGPWIGY